MNPRLHRLERRLIPSAAVVLLSDGSAGQPTDTAGGPSYVAGGSVTLGQNLLSADGRYCVFMNEASNVVAGQTDHNRRADVFLYDRVLGVTTLVSHVPGTATRTGNSRSGEPTISADGRYVAFMSTATDLVTGFVPYGTSFDHELYLFDRLTGVVTLVSHAFNSPTKGATGDIEAAVISADGAWVTYVADGATNLIAGFLPGSKFANQNVYLYERASATNTLVSHQFGKPTTGDPGGAKYLNLTPDGDLVAFGTSGNLATGKIHTGGNLQTYVYDRSAKSTELVSHVSGSASPGNGSSYPFGISADGRFVTILSGATDLVSGFVNNNSGEADLFRYDRQTDSALLISRQSGSPVAGGDGASISPRASADGRFVSFESQATNLVAGMSGGGAYNAFLFDALTGVVTLVSHAASDTAQAGNGLSGITSISGDGRIVTYLSDATDLVSGFVDGNASKYLNTTDAYAYDRVTGVTTLISRSAGLPTTSGNFGSTAVVLSGDGQWAAFLTKASDITAGAADLNQHDDMFLSELTTGAVTVASAPQGPVSVSPGGDSAALWTSYSASVSADGRFVAFASDAANVLAGQVDGNGDFDIFVRDRLLNTTILVSHLPASKLTAGNAPSSNPTISADGRYVAYVSYATDLVSGFTDNNGSLQGTQISSDVFLYDRLTGVTTLVSRTPGSPTVGGNGVSGSYLHFVWPLALSGDGRFVAFRSQATDLVAGFVDTNSKDAQGLTGNDLYLFDRDTGVTVLVNRLNGQPTVGTYGQVSYPSISGDGRYVGFVADGQALLFDGVTEVTTLVSHAAAWSFQPGNGAAADVRVSADGRYVAYASLATDLIASGIDTNGVDDVFLFDRLTGVNTLVSRAAGSATQAGNGSSYPPAVSDDGRYVAYLSGSTNLVAGFVDGNTSGYRDVYLFDRLSGTNTLVSRTAASPSAGGNGSNDPPAISGDGRFVTWPGASTDHIAGLSGSAPLASQQYVYDRRTGTLTLASRTPAGPTMAGNGGTLYPTINADGSVVVFFSDADNLIAGDHNGWPDVFAYVTPPPRVQSIQLGDGSAQRSVVRSLTVTFDQPVFFAGSPAAAFVLTSPAGSVQLTAGSQTANGVTLTFAGPLTEFGSLVDGNYQLKVLASQITNIAALDGNGDGTGGDDFTFTFHRLFGDADGDRDADAVDFAALRLAFGTPSVAFDFDGDGDADAADFFQFRRRFGVTV